MTDRTETQRPLSAAAHAAVWIALAVLAVGLVSVARSQEGRDPWAGWRESGGFRHSDYAERIRAHDAVRTRSNTWSNLAYVLVGFYGFAFALHDRRNPRKPNGGHVAQTPALSVLFGAACCFLGAGSGFFHASLTHAGQQLDVASMYAPLLALCAASLGRWFPRFAWGRPPRGFPTWPLLSALVVAATVLLYRFKWSMSASKVLGTLILAVPLFAVLDQFRVRRTFAARWLAFATVALAAAVACRQLDVAGRFSGPDAWLQGHALWHVLTALSLAFAYLYHRSETGIPLNPAATPRVGSPCSAAIP
ncbi:MAG: ceramidase [Verrucomicrobia bacterium]|nr:MAG: ceramidase [Verrucomicrobiota bacterium]